MLCLRGSPRGRADITCTNTRSGLAIDLSDSQSSVTAVDSGVDTMTLAASDVSSCGLILNVAVVTGSAASTGVQPLGMGAAKGQTPGLAPVALLPTRCCLKSWSCRYIRCCAGALGSLLLYNFSSLELICSIRSSSSMNLEIMTQVCCV
jgi:hypothetical protein